MLLLFDNSEHVLTAVATLASALLSAAPQLKVLAPSQKVLGTLPASAAVRLQDCRSPRNRASMAPPHHPPCWRFPRWR